MPRPPQPAKIGLLGGSFNPAHEGHREISLAALERLGLDAVWWLVAPQNPLKPESGYAPYEERLATARKVAGHPLIVVSDFERRRGLQYTVDTLAALRDEQPGQRFVLLMGADSFAELHLLKEWRRIAVLAPIAVFNRPGCESAAGDSIAAKELRPFKLADEAAGELGAKEPPAWVFFAGTANPLSSTSLRGGAAKPPGA